MLLVSLDNKDTLIKEDESTQGSEGLPGQSRKSHGPEVVAAVFVRRITRFFYHLLFNSLVAGYFTQLIEH